MLLLSPARRIRTKEGKDRLREEEEKGIIDPRDVACCLLNLNLC